MQKLLEAKAVDPARSHPALKLRGRDGQGTEYIFGELTAD